MTPSEKEFVNSILDYFEKSVTEQKHNLKQVRKNPELVSELISMNLDTILESIEEIRSFLDIPNDSKIILKEEPIKSIF